MGGKFYFPGGGVCGQASRTRPLTPPPREIEFRPQWHSQMEFGNEEKISADCSPGSTAGVTPTALPPLPPAVRPSSRPCGRVRARHWRGLWSARPPPNKLSPGKNETFATHYRAIYPAQLGSGISSCGADSSPCWAFYGVCLPRHTSPHSGFFQRPPRGESPCRRLVVF